MCVTESCPKAVARDECHDPALLGQPNCLSLPDTVGKRPLARLEKPRRGKGSAPRTMSETNGMQTNMN